MPTDTRPLVLVLGATGRTGAVILDALIERAHFRVAALVREASLDKPEVAALRSKGVEIRVGELGDPEDKLAQHVAGVRALISTVDSRILEQQKPIFLAAKKAGVERVVPCDFGPFTPRGLIPMSDQKYAIRDFIVSEGIPHTFIDVGWWMQLFLPHPPNSPDPIMAKVSHEYYEKGDKKCAITDMRHIGVYVARIVKDARTIDRYVFVCEEEVSIADAWAIGKEVYGQDLERQKAQMTEHELQVQSAQQKEKFEKTGSVIDLVLGFWGDYMHSLHVRGDNTVENAMKAGALDARELYPDVKKQTLKEYAPEFYASPFVQFRLGLS